MKLRTGLVLAAVLSAATWLASGSAARADNLDQKLLQTAPRVMDYLKDKGYKYVGVLTFRFQDDPQKDPKFRGTLLNANMADRTERALVMAIDPEHPVYILAEARKTAATKIPGSNYRTANDRRRLFEVKYPLPVPTGERFVTPDAFVTGKVSLSKNYATTSVSIEIFDRANPEKPTRITSFDVQTDRLMLADAGRGYSLSRHWARFSRGDVSEKDIWDTVVRDQQQADIGSSSTGGSTSSGGQPTGPDGGRQDAQLNPVNPMVPGSFPVTLTIRYNDQPQQIVQDTMVTGQNFRVVDPQQGQRVTFGVVNTSNDRLGMVLTINGVNTLYEETGTPDQMARWVLEPGKEYRIQGFYQADMQNFKPIEGLSHEDSMMRVSELGGAEKAGLIHVYIFRPMQLGSTGDQFAMSRGGSLRPVNPRQLGLKGPPRTWAEYQTQVAMGMKYRGGRGLMAPVGGTEREQLQTAQYDGNFLSDTMAIRYWSAEEQQGQQGSGSQGQPGSSAQQSQPGGSSQQGQQGQQGEQGQQGQQSEQSQQGSGPLQ